MKTLITCKENFEKVLSREGASYGLTAESQGQGWVLFEGEPGSSLQSGGGLCFASTILTGAARIHAASVNAFTDRLLEAFLVHTGSQRITDPWPLYFFSAGSENLIHHADTLKIRWLEKLRKKVSRVARLAAEGIPEENPFGDGLFVCVTDFHQAYLSFQASAQGQKRMKLDPRAPSRSYLKIEEAFHIFGCCPKDGETVIDLGASPGGWSHGALKRGASVTAIDNGPLREPVKSHPRITHLRSDALTYQPQTSQPVDWLLCDVLETPEVIIAMLHKWLGRRWCRYFVVNLKLGRRDPVSVLQTIRDPKEGLLPYCQTFYVRQLFHDRDEITLMGELTK